MRYDWRFSQSFLFFAILKLDEEKLCRIRRALSPFESKEAICFHYDGE